MAKSSVRLRMAVARGALLGIGLCGVCLLALLWLCSCVFQRFIRYLINHCLINTWFTASFMVITIIWIEYVRFSDVSPSSSTGKDIQWRLSRPWLRMNSHEAPLGSKRCGMTNSPDKTCTATDYDFSGDKCVFWGECSIWAPWETNQRQQLF